MATHILHIGTDDCHRAAVLQSAGYDVEEHVSLQQLGAALDEMPGADAVILSESENIAPEVVVRLVRECSAAPTIYFRRSNRRVVKPEYFDLVIPPLTPPEKWLKQVSTLLERVRAARAQGKSLIGGPAGLNKNLARRPPLRERELSAQERTGRSRVEP
jgi:hypothetical protein